MDDRKKKILDGVIEAFIMTAEPVGSKRLVEQFGLDISPATVRNELAALEEMGFVRQPHTSAGRVPSDLAYRYYVDSLERRKTPKLVELVEIRNCYCDINMEIGQLMKETSKLLSELTNCASLVWAPDIRKEKIKHIDLIGVSGHAVLVVLITTAGSLSKQVLDLGKKTISKEMLADVEATLNRAWADTEVENLADFVLDEVDGHGEKKWMVSQINSLIKEELATDFTKRVYSDGTENLIDKPDIMTIKRAEEVVEELERNFQVLEWLQIVTQECEVMVSIGSENELNLEGYSLVASGYEIEGEPAGVLGILGPTRMDYDRAIATVEHMAKNLGEVLAELQISQ